MDLVNQTRNGACATYSQDDMPAAIIYICNWHSLRCLRQIEEGTGAKRCKQKDQQLAGPFDYYPLYILG